MSGSRMPSSFEGDSDFYNEPRLPKLWKILKREPLIPIGTGLTCYALWRAYKSMRAGTHHETNRMFRMRIYGQAFTLLCLCGYAFFHAEEHALEKKVAQERARVKAEEKRQAWIKELEARDQEEKEERARQNRAHARRKAKSERLDINASPASEADRLQAKLSTAAKRDSDPSDVAKSALEACEMKRLGVLEAVLRYTERN